MKTKIMIGLFIVGIITIGITSVSALGNQSKAYKLAELTDKSVDDILNEKYEGNKTYGEVANENGVLEEFKAYNYEHKKNIVQEKVNDGIFTEEEGQAVLDYIEHHQANCDGTGYNNHIGLGHGHGNGQRHGHGRNR